VAKFVFKLEALLKQRKAVERQRMLALAELERERIAIEDRIRAFRRQAEQERDELRDQLVSARASRGADEPVPLDFSGVRFQASSSLKIIAKAQQAVLQLAGVHRQADRARVELLEAVTKRRAVETLKESHFEQWKAGVAKAEQAMTDDATSVRAARRDSDMDQEDDEGRDRPDPSGMAVVEEAA
jgi:flagellar biosynthesis chaperone FliJ